MLQALSLAGKVSQGELGQLLVMDSTTLTRTLRILSAQGWIENRPGKDRRERWLRLTSAGHHQLKRATPRWERAQARLRSRLGDARWHELLKVSTEVIGGSGVSA